ncbi:MAG: DNA-binding protein [Marinomonas sp.]|nr:MAG: DNA-binding protein [Marinomonas sp.]
MILALDGTSIEGYDHVVTCELPMPDEDLSGKSSSTAAAEGGIKPKRLRVSLKIKYENESDLADLVLLATDQNEDGSRKRYDIVNKTADAFNIRKVRFTERFNAQELGDIQAWSVSFVLVEHVSVQEKVEQRRIQSQEPEVPVADQSTAGAASEAEPAGGVEKVVEYSNKSLAEEGEVDEI